MSLFKNLFISFYFFVTLCIVFAHAARFDITNNCPYVVWAAAVPGGGRQLNPSLGLLMSTLAQPGAVFGPELGAILMGPGVAVVRPVTVVDFFNAKAMVHPQTLLLNSV